MYVQRKSASDRQTSAMQRNSQKMSESSPLDNELDDILQDDDLQSQRPKRPKRPKKSVNENLEPANTTAAASVSDKVQYPPGNEFGSGDFRTEMEHNNSTHSNILM